ncbi:MAG: hypothetical protein IJI41_11980 [Anaerolineaceae bacterium]|nr:hypothetical protein [Anaerolineaceae bacterium]
MERNIPHYASETIDFYKRTIYSVLRSKSECKVSGLEEVHIAMDSAMHPDARSISPDYNALIYSVLRLPACMLKVKRLILGQNVHMFYVQGFEKIESWPIVTAPARRRICRYDGDSTLAVFINSKSDIEDIVPLITALQIEWNKLHELLKNISEDEIFSAVVENNSDAFVTLAEKLLSSAEDLNRLRAIWKERMAEWLLAIRKRPSELRIKLLDSAMVQYSRAANYWVDEILERIPDLTERPVYFVSANLHSAVNLASGYALIKEQELQRYLDSNYETKMLQEEWRKIERKTLEASKENLMYYVLKKYQQSDYGKYTIREQQELEKQNGIYRLNISSNFEVGAQVLDMKSLDHSRMDPRIRIPDIDLLKKSDAYILNIDYPLGMAAFHLFSKLSEKLEKIRGVYVMGKAASLNGVRGDVIVPSVVQDMHSSNLYLFQNAFAASHVEPYLKYGSVLGGQKAVTVFGTFLQNKTFMEAIYRGGFTDIEMEAGPYLSAIYEMFRPQRHPENEIVDLNHVKIDVGFLHYVSDTPMNKGKNLGAGTLSYFGMDSTYAITVAILRRIFSKELEQVRK